MLTDADFVKRQNEIDQEIQKLEEQKLQILTKLKSLKQEKEELRHQYSLNRLKNRPDASEWLNKEYAWSEKVHEILKHTFKFEKFRPNQLAAVNATLSKKHVILVMPTGGGKSLVYQLPALITNNLSVVISPLIALIEDQLMALKRLGISAATVNSSTPKEEKKEVNNKMLANKLNLIFVTPEWIARTKSFMNNLTKIFKEGRLARFIIDEVHCCSQWGHDFRTDYLSLSLLKGQFPGVPILGLTATATSSVMVDVQKILQIPDAVIITSPYNRPNLFYRVVNKPEGKSASLDYLEKLLKDKYKDQSGIIYAGTQKECEELAADLRERGLRTAPYHANLEGDVKSKIHKRWTENSYQAVIATIAFGMGIDKPDVRFVIHYTVPKSLEGLYQESGRAGRDGKRADCILMFNLSDWLRNFALTKNKKEEKSVTDILQYCIDVSVCRRKMISKYFDDDWRSSDCKEMCDHCKSTSKTVQTYNVISCLGDILNLVNIAYKKEVNLTLKKLLDAWFHIGPKDLQSSSSKPQFSKEQAEHIVAYLLSKNFLIVRRGYSLVSTLPYIDTNNDESFDRKRHGDKILMQYCGTIKGVPLYVDNQKTSDRCVEEKTCSSKKEGSLKSRDKEKYSENSTAKRILLPSSSKIDLTNDDSDDDQISPETSSALEKKCGKRSRKILASSEDSDSSSSSSNDFESTKKKNKNS